MVVKAGGEGGGGGVDCALAALGVDYVTMVAEMRGQEGTI